MDLNFSGKQLKPSSWKQKGPANYAFYSQNEISINTERRLQSSPETLIEYQNKAKKQERTICPHFSGQQEAAGNNWLI